MILDRFAPLALGPVERRRDVLDGVAGEVGG